MELGKYETNKIYNEDCYESLKNIPDKSIDLICIDIPYDFEGNGGGGCFGTKKREYHKEYEKVSINTNSTRIDRLKRKSTAETCDIAFGIDYKLLDELVRIMRKINIYIWCSKKQLPTILNYFIDKNCSWDLITWHKTNALPACNNTYQNDTEYCLFAREKGVMVYGTVESKVKWYVTSTNKEDKELFGHPTIKPLNIIKNLIENSTKENEIVLDCFIGSGTTAVACKELKRRFIGFEINKEYFEIAMDRINGITKNGQTTIFTDFEQVELEI